MNYHHASCFHTFDISSSYDKLKVNNKENHISFEKFYFQQFILRYFSMQSIFILLKLYSFLFTIFNLIKYNFINKFASHINLPMRRKLRIVHDAAKLSSQSKSIISLNSASSILLSLRFVQSLYALIEMHLFKHAIELKF